MVEHLPSMQGLSSVPSRDTINIYINKTAYALSILEVLALKNRNMGLERELSS